ncbi:MAG TPA: beta-ketoacyl-ACP synthase 3 [Thermoanaerobaculia bacterium]
MNHHRTEGPPTARILGLGAYVPERVMENAEWSEHVDTTDEWIRSRTGIERRRIAGADETTATMAVAAARRALDDAGLGPADVDEIVVATDTPEVYIPDTAAFVQHLLGAREVPAYDLAGSGCAGFVQALDVARSRVIAGQGRVLVIGVELLTRIMDWSDRSTAVLFGDAAGAAVVGAGGGGGAGGASGAEIVAAVSGTDGSRWSILTLEAGGTRLPFHATTGRGAHDSIVMNGREVFREAVARMSEASRAVLAKAGATLADVALVVPHQANLRIIQAVGQRLGVAAEKVFVNVQDYGNTGSASIPLALVQARDAGRIRPGDLVLLTSFGAGFHWAAALVRF